MTAPIDAASPSRTEAPATLAPSSQGPTFSGLALRALARYPDRVALKWDCGQLSYRETAEVIGRMQAALLTLDMPRQATVALLSGNRAHTWCALVAAQASGLVTTAMHPKGSLDDHAHQLYDTNARVLVVDPVMFGERGAELSRTPGLVVLTLGPSAFGTDLLGIIERTPVVAPRDMAAGQETALIVYTGGTSGRPKGIVRTHISATAVCNAFQCGFEIPEIPRYLAMAPVSHVAGNLVLPTLLKGGTVFLLSAFSPAKALEAIERDAINMTFAVPTMIYDLLDHPDLAATDLSSMQLLVYGGSPISPARLVEGLQRIGPVFSQLYGLSECAPIATLSRADHSAERPEMLSACGFPVSSCDVALLDDSGREVPPGETGEICVRSAQVMHSYLNLPEETARAFEQGWLHTGDVARVDADGRLFIVDRKKDMIISGGFNVYSREVEDVLTGHSAVATAAVIGIPDARWGEAVAAFVVVKVGSSADAQELISLVRDRKGVVHAPKRLEFVECLPLTRLGKVDKQALRATYWLGQNRMVS